MTERARALHDSPWQGVVHITGGGSEFLSELLATAGASKTLLEATVPYAQAALSELLGGPPEQACSDRTARAMAMAAYLRARALGGTRPFGLACTASLATDRVKRGAIRAHLALQTSDATATLLVQPEGDRGGQEATVAEALWSMCKALLGGEPDPDMQRAPGRPEWSALLAGETDTTCTAEHDGTLLLPGSFNPLHAGHTTMLAVASEMAGTPGAFELSVTNADKPPLDYQEIAARLAEISAPVWLTRAPTFVEKARLFTGACFAVGADTMTRIGRARYYGGAAGLAAALDELAALKVSFLVFGRAHEDGFHTLATLHLPPALRAMCTAVPEDLFRMDMSSTALRQQNALRQQKKSE